MIKKIIVGLGNPGGEYDGTRHNIGKEIVNSLVDEKNLVWRDLGYGTWAVDEGVGFFIPKVFMNNSGVAVVKVMREFDLSAINLLIVRDDLDMELGKVKGGVFRSGSGGHNGLASTINELGTNDFWQIKVGIGRPENKGDIDAFVVGSFEKGELRMVELAIVEAKKRVKEWYEKQVE